MAQNSPQYCPRCGTETVPQQKFCATCGLPHVLQNVEHSAFPPPVSQVSMGGLPPVPQQAPAGQVSMGGFPPALQQAPAGQVSMGGFPPALQQAPAGQVSMGGLPQPLQQPPVAQPSTVFNPVPPSGKRKIGRVGLGFLLVALLLALIALIYVVLQASGFGKPAQAAIARTNINTSVTYAGTALTVLNVQRSQNFLDDPRTTSDGMVRVQIQAKNTFGQPITLVYSNVAHLVLPNGKEIATVYASGNPTIAAGTTQTSNVDFELPANEKVDLVRFGTADEAQLDVPLNGRADVNKYLPKTIKVTKTLQYLNIDWALVDATSQLSFNGRQASKGMRYITLTFNVSNPLMETVIPGSPYVYMHLKTDTSETTPISAEMPVSFDAGANGKTGTATFQVPQNSSALTLTLRAQENNGFDPATVALQL